MPPDEKIFVVSEGIFSMEGDIADLRAPSGWPSLTARALLEEAPRIRLLGATRRRRAPGRARRGRHRHGTSASRWRRGCFIAADRFGGRLLKHTSRPFVFRQPAGGLGGGRGRGSPDHEEGAGSAASICCASPNCCATSCARAALPCCGRDRHCSRGHPGRARSLRLCKALLDEGIYTTRAAAGRRAEPVAHLLHRGPHRKAPGRLLSTLEKVSNALGIER